MVISTEFRVLNITEKKIINKTLSKISFDLNSFLTTNYNYLYVLIDKNNKLKPFPEIFYCPLKLRELIIKFKFKIRYGGIYFGFIKKGEFYLSLEAVEFFDKLNLIPKSIKVNVNKETEKSILYGNNIKKKMIDTLPKHTKRNSYLIIYNQFNELIAITYLIKENYEIEKFHDSEIIALNLIDKGYYLRKQ